MNQPLRILHLEDDPDFSELVRSLLEREGIPVELITVTQRSEFEAALGRETFDVVLADYSLPGYTGIEALKFFRQQWKETPFLLISGTIGEQAAIESLRAGASDYVLKQWSERLVPALRRAIQEASERKQRRLAETELHRLEDQLRQAQKMEAVGRLAGGVAHDFNNILTVIHGHASLLKQNASLSASAARSVHQIGEAAERAAALTRQLLAFSRRQVIQPRRLNMNQVVSEMSSMLGRILGEDIALQVNYFPKPALVHADASMIEQVLLNLSVNARDAMPKGGLLTIGIAITDLQAGPCTLQPDARAGKFVCLSVSDRGCGIPPEHLSRIFEPFFTTKQVGKGTGLGLATVYGIVKQHSGWIEVDSQLGQGATFKVFLPYFELEAPATTPEQKTEALVRGGTETILVVEDEAPVREVVCELLTGYGYQVIAAESGVKALELWPGCKHRIDLMLTDLVMPEGVNGRELAEKLWAEQPGLKVIFTSGYSVEVVGKDFVLRPGIHYLQKPYPTNRLAEKVRTCLDS